MVASLGGRGIEQFVKRYVPLAPAAPLLTLTAGVVADCLLLGIGLGVSAGLYPGMAGQPSPHPAHSAACQESKTNRQVKFSLDRFS